MLTLLSHSAMWSDIMFVYLSVLCVGTQVSRANVVTVVSVSFRLCSLSREDSRLVERDCAFI